MTALLDFEDTGVLDVFIDEQQVHRREQQLAKGGLMPGRELASTFNSLRPNDLIWNYVVNNYPRGQAASGVRPAVLERRQHQPAGADVHLVPAQHVPREHLRVPNKLTCCGQPVDLNRIKVPTYVFAARRGPIVPWKAAYASARLMPGGGKAGGVRYVLGASGHIAGSINPASKNKRSYWTGGTTRCRPTPRPGCTMRSSIPAAGGPTGASGCRSSADR